MTNRFFSDHILGPDLHANRPAATAVPAGTLYSCSTHSLLYRSNGTTWSTWATLAGGAVVPIGGTTGQVLKKNSGTDYDMAWGAVSAGASYQPGSADAKPVSPNVKDDEFDGTSSATWSSTPTAPNAWDINTSRADHAYLKSTGGAVYTGKTQAVPAAYPYTITTKCSSTGRTNNHRVGGIILGPSSPSGSSAIWYVGGVYATGIRYYERILGTFAGGYTSDSGAKVQNHWDAFYIKVTVNSATSISSWISTDGFAWIPMETAVNPGFTPAVMGVASNDDTGGGGVEAFFDFFRIT